MEAHLAARKKERREKHISSLPEPPGLSCFEKQLWKAFCATPSPPPTSLALHPSRRPNPHPPRRLVRALPSQVGWTSRDLARSQGVSWCRRSTRLLCEGERAR